jgi:hypothetical protein
MGAEKGENNGNNNCIGKSNGHGNCDRDEEITRATAMGNGMLTVIAMAIATKTAY